MIGRLFMAAIRFYQRFLSPLKRVPTCRYLPTCSSYALEAIQRRGVARGTLMALWRILRCNPLFPGGFDPVDSIAGPGAGPSAGLGAGLGVGLGARSSAGNERRHQPGSRSADSDGESCARCARTAPAGHFNRDASPERSPDSTSDEVGYVRV